MHKLKFYRTLGLTRNTRRLRVRDNVLKNAERLHEQGLDSRIPFLKTIAGSKGAKQGSTANKEIGGSVPELKEGQTVDFTKLFLDQVIRFNIFNASKGLQIFPLESGPNKKSEWKVFSCKTIFMGDLRISQLSEHNMCLVSQTPACYFVKLYQIAVADDIGTDDNIEHEIEHAFHYTLEYLCGFPTPFIPKHITEYLAIISVVRESGWDLATEYGITDFFNPSIKSLWKTLMESPQNFHHARAAYMFVKKLQNDCSLEIEQIRLARDAWLPSMQGEYHQGLKYLERIREFCTEDYKRTYKKLFGLSLEDLKEIIDNLPMR